MQPSIEERVLAGAELTIAVKARSPWLKIKNLRNAQQKLSWSTESSIIEKRCASTCARKHALFDAKMHLSLRFLFEMFAKFERLVLGCIEADFYRIHRRFAVFFKPRNICALLRQFLSWYDVSLKY